MLFVLINEEVGRRSDSYVEYREERLMLTFLLIIEDEAVRNKMEEIYLTYHKTMFKVSVKILKDHHEAEDVVQDAILKISKHIEKINEINCKKTRGFVVTIVRTLSYDAYNRRKKVIRMDHEEIEQKMNNDEYLIEKQMICFERSREIIDLLSRLNKSYGDIITLRYYYEMSPTEISKLLDIRESNVYARLSRARKALKILLEKEGKSHEGKIQRRT